MHKNPKYLMNNELLNFGNRFDNALQNSWIWTFILQHVSLMCLKFWDIDKLCLRNSRYNKLMECDFNLLCWGFFKYQKL
jgi:hypothetical protein